MSSIIKVDTIQNQSGANIISESSNPITVGASGDTIIVPSGTTFDLTSATTSGVGKVGQVVATSNAMSTTYITSTSSVAISGFNVTITPTSTSSKIYVHATFSYTQDGYNNGTLAFCQLYRGSTNIKGIVAGGDTGNGDYGHAIVLSAYDSPATTSAVTYYVHAQVQNSSSQFRPTGNSDTITVWEILP